MRASSSSSSSTTDLGTAQHNNLEVCSRDPDFRRKKYIYIQEVFNKSCMYTAKSGKSVFVDFPRTIAGGWAQAQAQADQKNNITSRKQPKKGQLS